MRIKHGHIHLELHHLKSGEGMPLLLLHALQGSSADWKRPIEWPGPVHALDFAGHGGSEWIKGGGYYPEMLVGDADAALAHLGPCAVAGAGLGAYVALMLAGARPAAVTGALLMPGAGLDGGGSFPDYEAAFPDTPAIARRETDGFDPFVDMTEHFVRPPDYAASLAAAAQRILLLEDDEPRPDWWKAVREHAEVVSADATVAFARLRQQARTSPLPATGRGSGA